MRSPKLAVSPGPFDDWNADRTGHYNEADWGVGARSDWNKPNPDQVDGYPDVAVARATAHSVADVTNYVNKIIRYETQHPQNLLFTFVADGIYPGAPRRVDPVVANARLKFPAVFLQINKPDGSASARWTINASPADVASKINSSVWVGYLGHGSVNSWDGRGFGRDLVKLTANGGVVYYDLQIREEERFLNPTASLTALNWLALGLPALAYPARAAVLEAVRYTGRKC